MYLVKTVLEEKYLRKNEAETEIAQDEKTHIDSEMTLEDYLKKARIIRSETFWKIFRLHKLF